MNKEQLQIKTGELMYALTKHAARESFVDFLDDLGLTFDEYKQIRDHMMEKLNITKPYL